MCLFSQRRPPVCHMSAPGMKSTITQTVSLPYMPSCAAGAPWSWPRVVFPSTVAAKKQEEEEERARKDKAERGL